MGRIVSIVLLGMIIGLTSCAKHKAFSYDQNSQIVMDYKRNYSLRLPDGYTEADEKTRKRFVGGTFSNVPSDAKVFVNKATSRGLMIAAQGNYRIRTDGQKAQVLQRAKGVIERSLKGEIGDDNRSDITVNNDVIDYEIYAEDYFRVIKGQLLLYPTRKNTRRFAVMTLQVFANIKDVEGVREDFSKIISTLKAPAFSEDDRYQE